MEQIVDRRVRKTKKLLLQGLTELMSLKKINKITVKELTDLVDVNRATFYLYYKDIFDMVEKVETEMFESFREALDLFTCNNTADKNPSSFINFVFEFVKEYSALCKILLGPDGDYSFVEKFKKAIKDKQFPYAKPNSDSAFDRFFLSFAISGCIGIIQHWLEEDMKTPVEDMADFVRSMFKIGIVPVDK